MCVRVAYPTVATLQTCFIIYELVMKRTTKQFHHHPLHLVLVVYHQTTLTSYVANAKPYTRSSYQFKKCEDALLTFICKDMLPVCIVDSPHLKLFIETLDPRYQPSSRTHFTLLNSITFCLFFGVSFNFVIFF